MRFVALFIVILFFAVPAFGQTAIEESRAFARCYVIMTISSQFPGVESPIKEQIEGYARGALIAGYMVLSQDGFKKDYIDVAYPEWIESKELNISLNMDKPNFLQNELAKCVAINPRQTELVNIWREEVGKE